MMHKAVECDNFSRYHYEAAIAAEHLKAKTFDETNWNKILHWYQCLQKLQPMPAYLLTMAVVCIQKEDYPAAKEHLDQLVADDLNQRAYLFHGAMADYQLGIKNPEQALKSLRNFSTP